jgi:hypothetical protein
MITLSCGKCGNVDDLDNFCKTAVSGDLPNGQFQCPACGYAWKRQQSEYRVLRAGDSVCFIPGKVELVPVDARL